MDFKQLDRGEIIATVGGAVLGISLALAWFSLGNKNAMLNSCHGPNTHCSGWHSLTIIRYLLLLTAVAPLILAWIIVREHELSWPRGQVTMIVAIAAFGLIFYVGVIARPGDPSSGVSLRVGWFVALVGGILMLVGSVMRQSETASGRKPPGTL